jgi:hypothetical protein
MLEMIFDGDFVWLFGDVSVGGFTFVPSTVVDVS